HQREDLAVVRPLRTRRQQSRLGHLGLGFQRPGQCPQNRKHRAPRDRDECGIDDEGARDAAFEDALGKARHQYSTMFLRASRSCSAVNPSRMANISHASADAYPKSRKAKAFWKSMMPRTYVPVSGPP